METKVMALLLRGVRALDGAPGRRVRLVQLLLHPAQLCFEPLRRVARARELLPGGVELRRSRLRKFRRAEGVRESVCLWERRSE